MVDKYHLTIIKMVDQYKTLTEAANQMYTTQSALSHAIKKLENQLAVKVWVKEGRALHFTSSGLILLDLANRVLPQIEHAEYQIKQIASGQRGNLRIGMECHPCYQWFLGIVEPYLQHWRDVDLDVKQQFQFSGMEALENHDIDALVTPDPEDVGINKNNRFVFTPVFNYELVLVMANDHPLASLKSIEPHHLRNETLITYPVEIERLDIFKHFLIPANCRPNIHKHIETTDIMLQMVASHRGVTALPAWLARDYQQKLNITSVSLGKKGIDKQIFIGIRKSDNEVDYIRSFINLAEFGELE
ncbi:LysR family transcriptional regulator [Vibrio sp. SS-MA-C1-2]|uniref:LysR family transcriptional regulator n=1 Tax=Vibrio sp. SS-MA-C1-2 TaxID=2908646 RepID=UPI001F384F53|nr:LysR family transcriptional regulator [Vibrio sp. SS-MA-C1-2]UJF17988.1 LysR family transcriptional regulator [Vibrio sp. SS-MA-C1-2]